jgi:RNA polymerase sigma factor (sigma-70 family)
VGYVNDPAPRLRSAERTASPGETEGLSADHLVTEVELAENLRVDGKLWCRLKRFACSFLRDGFEAEDIVQEVYERVLRAIRNGRAIEPPGFSRYCYKVAYRLCLNRIYSARRLPVCSGTTESEDGEKEDLVQTVPERSSWKHRAERRMSVMKALGELPARERLVIELSLQGLADVEIAAQVAVTENNARQIRYRALAKLKAIVADAYTRE